MIHAILYSILFAFTILALALGLATLPIFIVFGLAFKFYKLFKYIQPLSASKERLKETEGCIVVSIFCYSCGHHFYISMPYLGETYSSICPYCKKKHYV